MRRLLPLSLLLLVAALPAAPAAAASRCSLSRAEKNGSLGATYVTKLTVSHTSCTNGKRVVRAFNACRKASGGAKGHCRRTVRGLRCSEVRNAIPTQFNSNATCRGGAVVVRFTYTQFT